MILIMHRTLNQNRHTALPFELRDLLPDSLARAAEPLALVQGSRLFEQDGIPQRMFYVASGEVALERCSEDGARAVLQRVRNGFLAEASLASARYHCDAVVTRSGTAVALPIDTLRAELQTRADFAMRWIAMLSAEIRKQRSRCERLSLKSVAARLFHLIDTEGDNGRMVLTSSLKSLAVDLGISHEALYRELARLERKGRLARLDGEIRRMR
jgi:CRP-like cAMP-binding protein